MLKNKKEKSKDLGVDNSMKPSYVPSMSRVKNVSLQTLELYQTTNRGPIIHFVQPGKIIEIPTNEVSNQMKTLAGRRMLKII